MKLKFKKPTITERRDALAGLAFISPWIIGFCLFFAFPIFRSIQLSFVNVLNMSEYEIEWAGLQHYKFMFREDAWYVKHFATTATEMLAQIPLTNVFALFIAILLNRKFPGRTAYRTIFFLPVILGSGFIMTQLLGQGVQGEAMEAAQNVLLPMEVKIYLGGELTALVTDFLNLITSILWKCGVQIIIYLSGLQSVSPTLYEAARVDSATEWEMFWLITLPMLTPTILMNLIYSTVDCFINADNLLFRHIQNTGFALKEWENSAAMSWVFFLFVILLVAIIFAIMRPFVNKVKD
ncbi:MAG: sugar ABC transporter permease [Acutalibacteraceae bacterium]|nr:sugar ABC transporter permease [Acutalibacteraceae bacterium]